MSNSNPFSIEIETIHHEKNTVMAIQQQSARRTLIGDIQVSSGWIPSKPRRFVNVLRTFQNGIIVAHGIPSMKMEHSVEGHHDPNLDSSQ